MLKQFQIMIEKIIEKEKIDSPNTQVHDHSLSWLDTGTSILSVRNKVVLYQFY
jgi:hypothetical protein